MLNGRVNARVALAASLVVLAQLAVAGRAAAETPVVAPLVDSGRLGHPQRHGHRSLKPFLHHRGADSLARAKEEAAIFAPTPSTPTINPLVASTVVTGFDGINEEQSFAEPPDGAIAVSPTYIVEAVNDELSVWTKTYDATGQLSSVTNVVSAASLDVFFGHNPNCYTGANHVFGLVSDPSLDYDAAHDRFMLSMISFDRFFLISSLCVAVTTTGDPSGTWFVYAFNIQPAFNSLLDFPRAVTGSDGQIYVTGNLFTFDVLGNPVFQNARAYAFKASDMYVGSATTGRVVTVGNDPQTGAAADSLTPARAVGVAGMYFVSASNAASTGSVITLWRWTDPFGSNAFTRRGWVTVSPYAQPPSALQPRAFPPGVSDCAQSGALCITTNDARNLAAYWSNNTVWATHTIGCAQAGTPVACVQWYQLGGLDGTPALMQQGIVDDGSPGQYRYFPSLAVDQNGNVALAYAHSSATDYAGIRYTTIVGGVQGPEVTLKAGEATIEESRYGDYAATAVDPHDNLTIWHVEEYAKNLSGVLLPTGWGTWVSAIQIAAAPPPTGDFSIVAVPTSLGAILPGANQIYTVTVDAGQSGFTGTVSLAVSGLPSGASGSFLPASVALTGTATSATSTLTVATTGATLGGTYTLTIMVSGSGITHTTNVTLAVQDFTISVIPASRTVSRGGSTSYTVTVNPINDFSASVGSWSLTGLPGGVTYNPLPTSTTPGGSFRLTLMTSRTTRRGTYTLTLTGTGAGVTRQRSFQLRVTN